MARYSHLYPLVTVRQKSEHANSVEVAQLITTLHSDRHNHTVEVFKIGLYAKKEKT